MFHLLVVCVKYLQVCCKTNFHSFKVGHDMSYPSSTVVCCHSVPLTGARLFWQRSVYIWKYNISVSTYIISVLLHFQDFCVYVLL